jgi:CheY-like chemotaxis protein
VPKILVADDNTNIQKMVSLAFEDRGIDVVAVGNGEAAVRRIPDMNPDLVLADIFMPVRNGYEVCEFVKKDERFSHIPVILLVGAFDPLDEKEARRVGADGVLKKPFVPPDPLIAMVISALEKNPKIAAEMAKAREVVPEPAPLPLPPALETPARAEVKPLPEYPEPTPEEAALVYGFGSGKRGPAAELSAEDKGPISPEGEETEADEADADTSTHDWRRNAMDFEVPEHTSKSMAFAMDDDAATSMFPSEKDVPPKHVPFKGADAIPEEADTVIEAPRSVAPPMPATPPAPLPVASTIRALPTAPAAPSVDHDSQGTATMWGSASPVLPPVAFTKQPSPPPALEPVQSLPEVKVPDAKIQVSKPDTTSKTPEIAAELPVLEIEPANEPTFAARATHWMDAMTAALKQPEQNEWADPTPPIKLDLDAQQPKVIAHAQALLSEEKELAPTEELAVAPAPLPEDESFFAGMEEDKSEPLPLVSAESKTRAPLNEPELETSGPVPLRGLRVDPELIAEPEDARPVAKDPALVEPPSVRVTPQPLLVDDSAVSGPSGYDEREAETEPLFAFAEPVSNGEPAGADTHDAVEPEHEIDERIPTGPPPNREILATIPFLTPPPEILQAAAEEDSLDDAKVDAVVRKVLEKLEPQLHELLSQGVLKPLVENILQNETVKKNR